MTITDLKKYAERMNTQLSLNDRLQVTLRRDAMTYIGEEICRRFNEFPQDKKL